MKSILKKLILSGMTLSLLSGCADMPASFTGIAQEFQKTVINNPRAIGGSALGGLIGNKSKDRLRNAVIGLALGAVIDSVYAKNVRSQPVSSIRTKSNSEQLKIAKSTNDNMRKYNSQLKSNSRRLKAKTGGKKYKTTASEKSKLAQATREIEATKRAAEAKRRYFENQAKNIKSDPAKSAAMARSAKSLDSEIKQMEVIEDEYADLHRKAVL